jgi:hypothetical protein
MLVARGISFAHRQQAFACEQLSGFDLNMAVIDVKSVNPNFVTSDIFWLAHNQKED